MVEPYDRGFAPPAPVVTVLVGRPGGPPSVGFRAVVDTGADMTVLPTGIPEQLGLPTTGIVRVRSAAGGDETCDVHAALVQVAGEAVHVEVIGVGGEALLGRDLLARFVVTLDGPRQELRITPAARSSGHIVP